MNNLLKTFEDILNSNNNCCISSSVGSSVSSTPRPSGAVEDEYQQVPPHTLVSMTKNIVNL